MKSKPDEPMGRLPSKYTGEDHAQLQLGEVLRLANTVARSETEGIKVFPVFANSVGEEEPLGGPTL